MNKNNRLDIEGQGSNPEEKELPTSPSKTFDGRFN
jgi:hypothetical protein